jgi:hypothetical protein
MALRVGMIRIAEHQKDVKLSLEITEKWLTSNVPFPVGK